jgi:lysozyme
MTITRARGLDCSEYNNISWPNVPDFIDFAYIRSSSGVGYTDRALQKHYDGAKATGRLVGPYHYCLMSNDPVETARYFYQVASAGGKTWDLPPALDFEYPKDIMNHTADEQVAWLKATGDECESLFGQTPNIYSFPSAFKDDLIRSGNAGDLRKFGLWIADLSKGCPPSDASQPYVPPFMDGWTFWQVSGDNGPRLPGISTAIDQDVFNGTREQLFNVYGNGAARASGGVLPFMAKVGVLAGLGWGGYKLAKKLGF